MGTVSGAEPIGGLIGQDTPSVTTTSSYFLDTRPDNDQGTPLSLAEFADEATFVAWDFDDIWVMSPDLDRSVLAWE